MALGKIHLLAIIFKDKWKIRGIDIYIVLNMGIVKFINASY